MNNALKYNLNSESVAGFVYSEDQELLIIERLTQRRTHKIIDLLPQSKLATLTSRKAKLGFLNILAKITQYAIKALRSFLNNKYYKFDAQVGETACQVRACMLLMLSSSKNKPNIHQNLIYELGKLKALETALLDYVEYYRKLMDVNQQYYHELDQFETIDCFVAKRNISEKISAIVLFLTEAYFLCEFNYIDKRGIPFGINFNKTAKTLCVSNTQARNIVKRYQLSLSKLSCKFLIGLSPVLPSQIVYRKLLILLQQKTNDGHFVFPCYEGMKILVAYFLKKYFPILLVIETGTHRFPLLFKKTLDGEKYQLKDVIEKTSQPCLVVYGITNYPNKNVATEHCIKEFHKYGIEQALLSNMARHPQFSGDKLYPLRKNPYVELLQKLQMELSISRGRIQDCVENERLRTSVRLLKELMYEYKSERDKAYQLGCCKENSTFFLLRHIFCDTIEHQLDYIGWIPSNNEQQIVVAMG